LLNKLTYKLFGVKAILIEWPAQIDENNLKDIIQFKEKVNADKNDFIEDCIIGYNSLTIIYLNEIPDFISERDTLELLYLKDLSENQAANFSWKVPVCYDLAFGIDLEEISKNIKLPIEKIIRLHTAAIYTVYFIGFLPGFLYLGGLDNRLEMKRKSDPRLNVPKGSVAIGGAQTGVYPTDSAGGWNIIGRTPISFFDIKNSNPCFAKSGDKIQFVAINLAEFKKLEAEANNGIYEPSKIKLNG